MKYAALGFVALFVLLASACDGGDGAVPAATPTNAATSIAGATQRPEATATRPPEPTATSQAPAPTATRETPSGGPPPLPTPTATAEPSGLRFFIGPSVSDFDRSLVQRAVEVTRRLLSDDSGVEPPSAVFVYESSAALAEAFRRNALAQPWRGDNMANRMANVIAEASYRGIAINTGSQGWLSFDASTRLRVVAHEFVHVIQLEHAGLEVANSTLAGPNTGAPAAGPFWLLEGSAELVSWLVMQELQLGDYASALLEYAYAASDDMGLDSMESFTGFTAGGYEGLSLSVLATDYLLRSRSLQGLFDFWRDIGRDVPWETAFTRHFGMPPRFFYVAFAQFYEETWAHLGQ
jgi:hypothetical protein